MSLLCVYSTRGMRPAKGASPPASKKGAIKVPFLKEKFLPVDNSDFVDDTLVSDSEDVELLLVDNSEVVDGTLVDDS